MVDTLALPLDDVVGQGAERRRPRAESREPLLRSLGVHRGLAPRGLEPVDRGIGRLLLPLVAARGLAELLEAPLDRKSTRLNSSHITISYAVFCLKKKKIK